MSSSTTPPLRGTPPPEGNDSPSPKGRQAKPDGVVPKLRFPEFMDAEAWINKQLCEVADVNASGDLDSENFSPTKMDEYTYPIYSNSVSQKGLYGYCAYPKYQKDSVTITARGTLGVAFYRDHDYVGIGRLLVLGNLKNVAPYFLQEIWNYSAKIPLENGGIPQLTAIKARAVELYMPEKEEQQKIADCLTSLDERITLEAQKLDTLKTHKKGLMQQLFPAVGETLPKLRFPEFREAGEWEEKRAGALFSNRLEDGEDGLPIYSVTMNDGMVKRSSLERRVDDIAESGDNKKVCKGDIAYNMMRMWQGAFGVAPEDCMVSPAYVVLSPECEACPDFFGYLFKLPKYLQLLTSHSQGLTLDRLRLYYKDFARISVLIPSPPEQQKIAACLASIDDLITAKTQKLAALKTHKKGLMQQLFPALEDTYLKTQ
jgi:type I restriction enzyme S subunit